MVWYYTQPIKLEFYGPLDIYGDYVDQTMFQDTELYYFNYNTYYEDYYFTINIFVFNEYTLKINYNSLLP